MDRRESIKTLMAASGILIALPSWAEGWSRMNLIRYKSSFTLQTQETLAAVADTIIPKGDSIGALSVGVDKFLEKLIENCYEKGIQDNVKLQLQSLEASAHSRYAKPFKECDQVQREAMLLKLSDSAIEGEADFFKLIKGETIRGFNTSREVMIDYLHFKQVPGHYYGCVDVNA